MMQVMAENLIEPILMVGVMSGTSADGIDIAIVEIGREKQIKLRYFQEHPMPEGLREPILRLAEPGFGQIDKLGRLDRAVGEAIGRAVMKTLQASDIAPEKITAIGSHGQTIRHRPAGMNSFSLQIGCPSTIAEITAITTVADFRRRDIAAGGQGAPLTPFAHRLLFASECNPACVLNIGGIANLTWLPLAGEITGFDTGPGNMLMDGLMLAFTDGRSRFDHQGQLAASGCACALLLEQLKQQPFFCQTPPKSCGREEFGKNLLDQIIAWPDISEADRLATAMQLTIDSIAAAQRWLPGKPAKWYVCGGGEKNVHMMDLLSKKLMPAVVCSTEDAGIPPQAVEAVSFAILAWCTLLGRTNTVPEVTGARHAVVGGHIIPGRNWPNIL